MSDPAIAETQSGGAFQYVTWPYQSLFEPILVTASPTVALDWNVTQSLPTRRKVSAPGEFTKTLEASLIVEPPSQSWMRPTNTPPDKARRGPEGIFTIPREPSLFIEPASQSWMRPTNTPTLPKRQASIGLVADLAAWTPGTLTMDKWWEPASTPLRRAKSIFPEQYVKPWEPSLIVEPALESWHRPQNIPPDKKRRNPEGIFILPWEPSLYIEPPLDSWLRLTNIPQMRSRRNPEGFFVSALEPSLTQLPPALSWFSPTRQPLSIKRIVQGFTIEPFQVAPAPSVEVAFSTSGGVIRVNVPWCYQGLARPLEPSLTQQPPSVSQWARIYELPIRKTRTFMQTSFDTGAIYPFPVAVTFDWFVQQADVTRRKGFNRTDGVEPFQILNLDWCVEHQMPVRSKHRAQIALQPTIIDLATPVDWHGQLPGPTLRKKSPEGLMARSFVIPETPYALDWLGQQMHQLPRPKLPLFFSVGTLEIILNPVPTFDWYVQNELPIRRVPPTIVIPQPFFVVEIGIGSTCPYLPGRGDEGGSFSTRSEIGFEYPGRGEDDDYTPGRGDECR